MDQLGRSVLDLTPDTLLVMGTERSAAVEECVRSAGAPEGVRLATLGVDFNPATSDYRPFEERKIPFAFLTSGPHEDYHRPGDVPAKVDWAALAHRTDFAVGLVAALAARAERPSWREELPPPKVAEIAAVRDLVASVEPHAAELGLPAFLVVALANFRKHLDEIVASGKVTAEERTSVVNSTKMLLAQARAVRR
jgi:hypothetical protein